jgi:RNA polymerase sigma factor (sigma-70 family)
MAGFSQGVDPGLIRRARRGDRAALESLYRIYRDAVYTLALRILDQRGAAEDVLQETFVEVLRKLSSLREDASLGGWIRSVAVNKCLMQLRSAWHRNGRALEDVFEAGDGGLPDPVAPAFGARAEARVDLEGWLSALPAVSRAVLWLHDVEGFTHAEIAALLERTESFSKSQLARAHARILLLSGAAADEEERCTPVSKTC